MTLTEALKESEFAVCKQFDSLLYFFKDRKLHYRGIKGEGPSTLSPWEVLHMDWEPYKEPCKHEPKIDQSKIIFFQGKTEVKSKPIGEPWFYPECKHCGVKIQAKEWTAV